MNRKSKVFGLLAAFALSLSMFAGAAAQSSTDYEWVSVELTDPGGYICAIDIYVVGGSFGTWEFNGAEYVETSGDSTMNFFGDLYGNPPNGCNVAVSFDGLLGWNNGEWISPDYFSAYSYHQGQNVDPWAFSDSGVFGIYDFDYTLESVPNVSADYYEGTINAFVANTP